MNPFHDINPNLRDPRTYGKNNNDRQFFPPLSATPGPSFSMTPSYGEQRTSLSPKPMHQEKVSTIDQTTLAVVPHTNNNDRDILHVDFYNAFKRFPTNNFNSEVHINCVASLKRIFSLFKDNDKLVRGNWDDARRRNDELFRDLREKEDKIQQLEFSEAEAKKAFDDGKESVSKMRIDTLRYKTEADKAKNELSFVTSEKNRLIVAISDEKDRHMKTVAKYDALNVQYANLFRENEKLNNDLIKIRQKNEQMEVEKVEKHLTPPPQEPASSSHSSRRAEKEKKKAVGEGHKKLQKQKHRDKTAVLEKLKPSEMAHHRKLASVAPTKPPQDNVKSAVAAENEEASSPSIHEEGSSSSHSSSHADKKEAVVEDEKSSESLPTQNLCEETTEMSDAAEKKQHEKEKTPMPAEILENEDEQPTPSGTARRQRPSNAKTPQNKKKAPTTPARPETSVAAKKTQEKAPVEAGESGNEEEEEQPTPSGSARRGKKSSAAAEKAQEETPVEAETPKENELTPSTQEEQTPSGRPSRRAKAEGAKRTSAIYQKPKPKKSTPRQKRSHPVAAAENDVEAHEEEETTVAPPPAKRGRPSTKK